MDILVNRTKESSDKNSEYTISKGKHDILHELGDNVNGAHMLAKTNPWKAILDEI